MTVREHIAEAVQHLQAAKLKLLDTPAERTLHATPQTLYQVKAALLALGQVKP
jgi:hypothetical protein